MFILFVSNQQYICFSLLGPRLVVKKNTCKISKAFENKYNMNRAYAILRLGRLIVSFCNSWTFSRTSAVTDRVHIRRWEITDIKAEGEVEEKPSNGWTVWEPCGLFFHPDSLETQQSYSAVWLICVLASGFKPFQLLDVWFGWCLSLVLIY